MAVDTDHAIQNRSGNSLDDVEPTYPDNNPACEEDPPAAKAGPSDERPPSSSTATKDLVDHKFDSGRRSDRLKDLAAAGKLKTATTAESKATGSRRRHRSGKVGQAGPSQQIAKPGLSKKIAKVVPYQQVEEGVFIQQVRLKIIKVGYVYSQATIY